MRPGGTTSTARKQPPLFGIDVSKTNSTCSPTLLYVTVVRGAVMPALIDDVPVDHSLVAVGHINQIPSVVAVKPDKPWKTLAVECRWRQSQEAKRSR